MAAWNWPSSGWLQLPHSLSQHLKTAPEKSGTGQSSETSHAQSSEPLTLSCRRMPRCRCFSVDLYIELHLHPLYWWQVDGIYSLSNGQWQMQIQCDVREWSEGTPHLAIRDLGKEGTVTLLDCAIKAATKWTLALGAALLDNCSKEHVPSHPVCLLAPEKPATAIPPFFPPSLCILFDCAAFRWNCIADAEVTLRMADLKWASRSIYNEHLIHEIIVFWLVTCRSRGLEKQSCRFRHIVKTELLKLWKRRRHLMYLSLSSWGSNTLEQVLQMHCRVLRVILK